MFLKESVSSKFSLMQIVTHSDLTCSTRFSDGRDKFCQIHTNHVMKMNLNIKNFLMKKFFRILHFIMKLVEGCVFILNKCIYRVSYNTLYNYPLLFSHSYLTFRKGDQNQLNHSQQLTHSSHNLIGCCPGQPECTAVIGQLQIQTAPVSQHLMRPREAGGVVPVAKLKWPRWNYTPWGYLILELPHACLLSAASHANLGPATPGKHVEN